MNSYKYVKINNSDAKKLKSIWIKNKNNDNGFRALALLLSNKKCIVPCIAKRLNEPDQNIRKWITKFSDEGLDMFENKNAGGRPPILNAKEHLKFIKSCVKRNDKKKRESILCIQKRLKKDGIKIKDASIVNYFKKYKIEVIGLGFGMPEDVKSGHKNNRNRMIKQYNDTLQKNKNIVSIIKYLQTSTLDVISYNDMPSDLQNIFPENNNNSSTNFYPILLNYIKSSVDETNEYLDENALKLLAKEKK